MKKESTITKEIAHVDYYCDICGELIDSADEFDDGLIPNSIGEGAFELELKYRGVTRNIVKIARFQNNSCLCDECKEKAIDKVFGEIEKAALELGIKKIK